MRNLDGFKKYLLKSEFSMNTINCYQRDVNVFLSQLHKDIKELDEFDLLGYKQVLLKQETCVKTLNRKLASINTYCRYLYEEKVIDGELLRVKLIKNRDKPEYKGVPQEQLVLIREQIYQSKNPMHICILETLLGTGMRVSELANLNLNDIVITGKANYIRILGKGMVNRTLPMNQQVQKAIMDYLKVRKQSESQRLLIGQRGAIGRGAIEIILNNYGKKVGVDITPHMLRHNVGYQLVKQNTPMTTIQQVLGHDSILTSMLYTQTTEQDKAKALMNLHW